jgi:hypothetical protein
LDDKEMLRRAKKKAASAALWFYSSVAGDLYDLSIHQRSALKVSQLMELFIS